MTQQASSTAAEIEGMQLAAVHQDARPWAELLQGPHPPEVSRVVGALAGVVLDRNVRLMVAWTLHEAGLLADEDKVSLALLQRRALVEPTQPERTCTQRGNGDLYPRRCSQCGQRWADRACGPTHAQVTKELGIDDLRLDAIRAVEWAARLAAEIAPPEVLNGETEDIPRWAAAVDYAHRKQGTPGERAPVRPEYMRTYLAETLGLAPEQVEVTSDRDLLLNVAHWVQLGKQAALKRRDEPPGAALTWEELAAEFAKGDEQKGSDQ